MIFNFFVHFAMLSKNLITILKGMQRLVKACETIPKHEMNCFIILLLIIMHFFLNIKHRSLH